MFIRISIATISLLIGACASSGPEAPAPAVADSSSSGAAVASDATPTTPAGDLKDPNASDMQQVASASSEYDPDEIVCRRERETGSKFTVKTCRTRAEIKAREERDQEAMRTGRKIKTGGQCKLTGEC